MANLPYSRLQLRRGTKEDWKNHDVVLYAGEPGLEITTTSSATGESIQKCKMKIGDGISPWSKLKYMSGSGSGGSDASTTIKITNPTIRIIKYGSMYNFEFEISVIGECASVTIIDKMNDSRKTSVKMTTNDDITYSGTSSKFTINEINKTYSYEIIVNNDESKEVAKTTYSISPGYYVFYWLQDEYDSVIPSNSYKYKNGELISSLSSTGINVSVPEHNDNKLYLYIAIPDSIGIPVFVDINSGFTLSVEDNNIHRYDYMYDNNKIVKYAIYRVGSMGLPENTEIKIKK